MEVVAGVTPMPPVLPPPSPSFKKRGFERTRPPGDAGIDQVWGKLSEQAESASDSDDMAAKHARPQEDVDDGLECLKIPELKELCKEVGLKVAGKKQDLVDRIRAHRAEQAAAAGEDAPKVVAQGVAADVASAGADVGGEQEEYEWGGDVNKDGTWQDDDANSQALGHEDENEDGDAGLLGGGIIKYMSTRGNVKARWRGRLAEALREGISNDGGLLVPTLFPDLRQVLPKWAHLSFPELALEMAKIWMGREWDDNLLSEIFKEKTFSKFADSRDPLPVKKLEGRKDVHVLELFHGPTGAPGDSITLPLAHLLRHITERRKGRATVVTPWTQSLEALSVASACNDAGGLSSFVIAPLDLQPTPALESVCRMGSEEGGDTKVVFMPSDHEKISELTKEACCSDMLRRQYASTTLDSTNAAHMMFTVTNYVYAYLRLRPSCDGPINVALDPGDYTQPAAAYYARLMGVPIHTVIVATPPPSPAAAAADDQAAAASGATTQCDATTPGLERLAFEFCGRDAGRIVHAAAKGPDGIHKLVDDICPPDFVRVAVAKEAQDDAAASTSQELCSEASRALAAASAAPSSHGDMPLLLVAPRRAGGSLDDGAGPAGMQSGSAASPGKRTILVSSVISIRDYISDTLPPYPPLIVPGPQAVAALNHLKRLGISFLLFACAYTCIHTCMLKCIEIYMSVSYFW